MTALALLGGLSGLGAGCAAFDNGPMDAGAPQVCQSDSECGEGQVCFADGCGDPGKDLVVEVTPNPQAGLHAQDFALDLRVAHPVLELQGPALLAGQVRREADADAGTPVESYGGSITVRATGESELLPGVQRRYESTVTPEGGGYRLPVGTGSFTVSLIPNDATLPPQTEIRSVQVGAQVPLDFLLPAQAQLTPLVNVLVREPAAAFDADMDVQLLDTALKPLSQRVPVTRATGAFTLYLSPAARSLSQVVLQATPRTEGSLLPQKSFTFKPDQPPSSFSLGAFGLPTTLEGDIKGPDGLPVVGAAVRLQGTAEGGGTFRSKQAVTDGAGHFVLQTLATARGTSGTLTIAPVARPTSGSLRAAITQVPVQVAASGTQLNATCISRGEVTGTVLRPDGIPAPGVRVLAQPLGPVGSLTAPSEGPETITDAQGAFRLLLDPAEYRLDFVPATELPRVSRFLTVAPAVGSVILPQDLPPFSLSQGRLISGPVISEDPSALNPNLPYASIRIFRVVSVNGRPTSQLLAQTVSDANGQYKVTLPTR